MQAISRAVILFAGARLYILPLAPGRLERTSLGKISRGKARASFLNGDFQDQVDQDARMLGTYRVQHVNMDCSATEQKLMQIIRDVGFGSVQMGTDMTILDTSVNSGDLIRLKREAEKVFSIRDIPVVTQMENTSISALASAIDSLHKAQYVHEYNPIMTLQSKGSKTPSWLLHPGIGEMLVFLGLVRYAPDRPIYAMRARGLYAGETPFSSL